MKKASKCCRIRALILPVIIGNLFAALILSTIGMSMQAVNASSSTSYDQGYNAGRNDALDGKPYNAYCPPNNPELRCAIYQGTCAVGYVAAGMQHGNDEGNERNDQDFSDRTDNDNNKCFVSC